MDHRLLALILIATKGVWILFDTRNRRILPTKARHFEPGTKLVEMSKPSRALDRKGIDRYLRLIVLPLDLWDDWIALDVRHIYLRKLL
jgi:hypothetical protein